MRACMRACMHACVCINYTHTHTYVRGQPIICCTYHITNLSMSHTDSAVTALLAATAPSAGELRNYLPTASKTFLYDDHWASKQERGALDGWDWALRMDNSDELFTVEQLRTYVCTYVFIKIQRIHVYVRICFKIQRIHMYVRICFKIQRIHMYVRICFKIQCIHMYVRICFKIQRIHVYVCICFKIQRIHVYIVYVCMCWTLTSCCSVTCYPGNSRVVLEFS